MLVQAVQGHLSIGRAGEVLVKHRRSELILEQLHRTHCTFCNLSVAKLVVSHSLIYLSSLQFILIVAILIVYLAAVSS